jgi:hypothetical protein
MKSFSFGLKREGVESTSFAIHFGGSTCPGVLTECMNLKVSASSKELEVIRKLPKELPWERAAEPIGFRYLGFNQVSGGEGYLFFLSLQFS